jgi:tetratricopeptide (TPR) repeat protein
LLPEIPDDYDLSASPPDLAGQRFGPYRIVREIGRGGMGAVYLAERDDDQFKQLVALKILRGEFNPRDVSRRFLAERQILANLNHPHICRLLDGGATPSGEPYLVMDYIVGVPIDQYFQTRSFSVKDRIEIFRQVCSAVQYVHQNLIVHRDLKPGNILVTPAGEAKLLDFGIAKILKSDQPDPTRTEALVMTLAYASPEQIRGEPITTATDVYALGVILYELLTSHRPYRLKTTSPHELPRAIIEDEPDRPSTAVTRAESGTDRNTRETLQRSLRGDLDNILLKALRKEPDRRYSSVELFSEDLRRHLVNLPVTAHDDSFGYRAAKFIQRYKLPVVAAAIAAISVIAGLVTTIVEARIARSERALAESRFQDVRKLATTFLFDVHDAIQELPGSTPARALIAKTGTEYLDRLAAQSHGDSSLQQEVASGYLKIGDVEGDHYGASLGETTKAIAAYRKGLALAKSVATQNPNDPKIARLLAWAQFQLAGSLPFDGKTSEGLDHANESLRLYQQLLVKAPADPETKLDVSRAYERQGDLLGGAQSINLGRKPEAAVAYRHSLDLIPDRVESQPLSLRANRARVIMTIKLASVQTGLRAGPAIVDRYKEALRFAEDNLRANPNDRRSRELVAYVLNKVAGAQQNYGDYKSALESYLRAGEIDDALMKADPNNAGARQSAMGLYKNLADVYYYSLHQWADALKYYRRAGELMEIANQTDPTNGVWRQRLSEDVTCIASCLIRLGQPDEARRQTKRGLDIARELADRPHATHDHIYNYAWLAVTVDPVAFQEPKRALPYAQKAVQMDGGTDEYSLHVLAQAYAGVGDFAHAIESEQRGLALFPPGAAKSDMQKIMEDMLQICQTELKKSRSHAP